MDATVCESREWEPKTRRQDVESIRWAELVHHYLHAQLWHAALLILATSQDRSDARVLYKHIKFEKEEETGKMSVAHEQRTQNQWTWATK